MAKRYQQGFLFRKVWIWFEEPRDITDASMVNFFSYKDVSTPGFYKKETLTTVIDLTKDLETLWENMRKSFVRKQIGYGERRGIEIKINSDFDEFAQMNQEFRKIKGLPRDNISVFKKEGILFSAYFQGELLAGSIFLSDGNIMIHRVLSSRYVTDKERQNMIGQANRMIMWEAIKYAKEIGHTRFDLAGIGQSTDGDELADSRAQYKDAFGGERIPCYYYHKVYSPFLKLWMRLRGFKKV